MEYCQIVINNNNNNSDNNDNNLLIPKQGDFTSENQCPITCLNTSYKWFTWCVLGPMDKHLKVYDLMGKKQRGAKEGCSGTTDNLLIDRTVTLDCHRHKCNLSIPWVDVCKAYDSVDHRWVSKIMLVHRFPVWICVRRGTPV